MTIRASILALCSLLALAGALAAAPATDGYGVLVMAHGGSPEWNQAVLDSVAPLAERYPLEVAFGMADACSMQEAVAKLEERGVRQVGVVRLFISGESWADRTRQILGMIEGAPASDPALCAEEAAPPPDHGGHAGHGAAAPAGGHGQHRMAFFRIETHSTFVLSTEGLADAPEMGAILADRARGLSRVPEREDVLVLAHGPGDDDENARWLAAIGSRASEIAAGLPFHRVQVLTLREDWPEKRVAAEERVRAFVGQSAAEGRKALVIPFRLFGFGPYAKVLGDATYVADQRGLLPHVNVTRWIARQAEALRPPAGDALASR